MSEFQYYEFRAIDRPLNRNQMDELRKVSTRAKITPTRFINTYSYGDFRGDPKKFIDHYFDAFVYMANWGSRRLMVRVPRDVLDRDVVASYVGGEVLSIRDSGDNVVFDLEYDDEGGDEWIDEELDLSDLFDVRASLMNGDYRALYLGWLASIQHSEYDSDDEFEDDDESESDSDDDRLEPPVPPGLGELSEPLQALAEFLGIEDELIKAAAASSGDRIPAGPSRSELTAWVESLPVAAKNEALTRFMTGDDDAKLRAELARRFREAPASASKKRKSTSFQPPRRTVAQLLAVRDALVEEREREEKRRRDQAKAMRERKEAEERNQRADALAKRGLSVWSEVENLIAMKRAKEYDAAVALLDDLRFLAERSSQSEAFQSRIRDLRSRHGNKPSLMSRLDERKL